MAHGHTTIDEADKQPMGAKLWPMFRLLVAGIALGAVVLVIGLVLEGTDWKRRFFFAYLVGYTFVLGLTVGSVALVVLTHLFRAGWVVAVRRVPETFAANFLLVGLLGIPILVSAVMPDAPLYPWSASKDDVEAKIAAASERIHALEHGEHHAEEADHAEPTPAEHADHGQGYFVASDADSAAPHTAPASGEAAGPAQAYIDATERMPGMSYPPDTTQALQMQQDYYWTLLGYMLDYKRFGGALDGMELVPEGKGFTWFSPMLFVLRMVVYFAILSFMGWFYWNRSVKQDESADPALTTRREWWAPPATVVFALTTTFMSFDLLMSLDPAWYSTMFGVIFFANSFTAGIAATILVCMFLQKKGYLKTVNVNHYHDLGKLLFAFVFFWGYVSFSQFMLIWYASLPETTYWFELHGMTTVETAPQYGSDWAILSLLMLFGHLLVPFGFLLSRHVKRNRTALAVAATWMLLMVYLDFYWYAMPFMRMGTEATFGLPEIGAVLLLLSVVLAAFVARFRKHAPLAYGDPRLHETTALDTSVWAPIHH